MGVNLLLIFFLFSFLLLSLSFIRLFFTFLGQLLYLFFPLCLGHIFDGLLLFFLFIFFWLLFLLPLFLYWWFCLLTLLGLSSSLIMMVSPSSSSFSCLFLLISSIALSSSSLLWCLRLVSLVSGMLKTNAECLMSLSYIACLNQLPAFPIRK